jgi:C_GCAxxG_C_C family probable redox protein
MANATAAQAKAEALARFEDQSPAHINCAQAVLHFALRLTGEDDDLLAIAKYLGGGVAGMGEACGALTGSALSLGALYRAQSKRGIPEPPSAADQLQALIRDFGQQFGACRCRDLTGYDLSDPEALKEFKASDIRHRCSDYVGWACDRLAPLLQAQSGDGLGTGPAA